MMTTALIRFYSYSLVPSSVFTLLTEGLLRLRVEAYSDSTWFQQMDGQLCQVVSHGLLPGHLPPEGNCGLGRSRFQPDCQVRAPRRPIHWLLSMRKLHGHILATQQSACCNSHRSRQVHSTFIATFFVQPFVVLQTFLKSVIESDRKKPENSSKKLQGAANPFVLFADSWSNF